ncbi:hypothetical protein [Streptomyces sp. NPDC002328]|uniref:hypothetical protein n=1 Tax=Streptomyces sp. NPDC002328 TaxID=3364642 RepID=UPI0036767D98
MDAHVQASFPLERDGQDVCGRVTLSAGESGGVMFTVCASGGAAPPPLTVEGIEDIKTAGSLSLLVSLPTMLVAFARYSRDGSFSVLGADIRFTTIMAAGSVTGAVLGGLSAPRCSAGLNDVYEAATLQGRGP